MNNHSFGLAGYPLTHTLSPFIHNCLFKLENIDADYTLFEVEPAGFKDRAKQLFKLGGFNITIPYKLEIIPFLDGLDPKASLFGSVNTVKCGEKNIGYNTDSDGFLMALKSNGIPLLGKVLLLGSGGVSRMMAFEAVKASCEVVIASRELSRAGDFLLKQDIQNVFKDAKVEVKDLESIDDRFDLLINGTPLGMYPRVNELPAPEFMINRCENVFDAIYNPTETMLIKAAKANGSKHGGGMAMLVFQAAVAHRIWNGSDFLDSDIESVIEKSFFELKKIFEG